MGVQWAGTTLPLALFTIVTFFHPGQRCSTQLLDRALNEPNTRLSFRISNHLRCMQLIRNIFDVWCYDNKKPGSY